MTKPPSTVPVFINGLPPDADLLLKNKENETEVVLRAKVCPSCGGDRKIIAAITQRDAIIQILDHLGLASDQLAIAPARAPPQTELWDPSPA